MKSVKFFIAAAFSALLLQAAPAGGQDKVTKAVIQAGTNDNRVMELEDFLANRIGGRPVGSQSLEDAEKWVEKQLRSWGLEVMVQEVGEIGVGFSRGPWSGRMLAEDGMVLHFGTPGYSAGTRGPQKGRALLEPKDRKELDRMRGALKGSWVLVNAKSSGFAVNYDDTVHLYREMAEAGVLGFIQPADLPIRVLYDRKGCYKLTMDSLPTVCDIKLDERQFAIIRNKLEAREDVTLEFDILNHFF